MDLTSFINEYKELMMQGQYDEAVRLTGMALAEADERWTAAVNSGGYALDALFEGNFIGARHIESLLQVSQPIDAFSTALMLLIKTALGGSTTPAIERSRMELLMLAITGLNDCVYADRTLMTDEDNYKHCSKLLAQLASMLYSCYQRISKNGWGIERMMEEAHEMLKAMRDMDAIHYPAINIAGKKVDVDSQPMDILSDTAGRARALGLLVID